MSARAGDIAGLRPRFERLSAAAGSLTARVASWPPLFVLGGAIVAQWALVLALARTVRHNGWVYYQGGDQLWYYTLARLVSHGQLWSTPVGYLWSFTLAPFARFAGADLVSALPAIVLFDVLVLLPVALLAVYGIASRLGGRVFGYWTVLLWLLLPFIGILYTDTGYHQRYTELLLPQAFGLTAMADFPTMVAVAVLSYFTAKIVLEPQPSWTDGAAAGAAAGIAVGLKPSAALALLGPVLALVLGRRLLPLAAAGGAMALPLAALAVWKERGLGNLPLLAHGGLRPPGVAAISPVVAVNLHKYFGNLSWHRLALNIDLLREHFWSGHLVIWLLLAGLVAIGRRSRLVAALAAGAVLPFAIAKGAYPQASIEDGSLFRLLMPIYPFFVLGIAALPLLLPGLPPRLESFRPAWSGPTPRTRAALLGAVLVLAAVLPLAVTAAAATRGGALHAATVIRTQMPIPIDTDLGLRAQMRQGRVLLTWRRQRPVGGSVFYRVWRERRSADSGLQCADGPGAETCTLDYGKELGITRDPARSDQPPRGTWVYRVAVAANWLDDPAYGDVYLVGRAVVVTVP